MIMDTYKVISIEDDLVELANVQTGERKRAWVKEGHECPVKVGDWIDCDHRNRLFLAKGRPDEVQSKGEKGA